MPRGRTRVVYIVDLFELRRSRRLNTATENSFIDSVPSRGEVDNSPRGRRSIVVRVTSSERLSTSHVSQNVHRVTVENVGLKNVRVLPFL